MEKIFSPLKKFRRDLEFFERLCLINFVERKLIFWIRREKSHEVTWKSDDLEKSLSVMKKVKVLDEKYYYDKAKKGLPKALAKSKAKMKESVDNFLA